MSDKLDCRLICRLLSVLTLLGLALIAGLRPADATPYPEHYAFAYGKEDDAYVDVNIETPVSYTSISFAENPTKYGSVEILNTNTLRLHPAAHIFGDISFVYRFLVNGELSKYNYAYFNLSPKDPEPEKTVIDFGDFSVYNEKTIHFSNCYLDATCHFFIDGLPDKLSYKWKDGYLTIYGVADAPGSFKFDVDAIKEGVRVNSYEKSFPFKMNISIPLRPPRIAAIETTVAEPNRTNEILYKLSKANYAGAPSAAHIDKQPKHGTARVAGTKIYYTPAKEYTGKDWFTVYLSNAAGRSAIKTVKLDVIHNFSMEKTVLPNTITGKHYDYPLLLDHPVYPVSLDIYGAPAPGIRFDWNTGRFVGRATQPGTYTVSIYAKDAKGATAEGNFKVIVLRDGLYQFAPELEGDTPLFWGTISEGKNKLVAVEKRQFIFPGSVLVTLNISIQCTTHVKVDKPVKLKLKLVNYSGKAPVLDDVLGRDDELSLTLIQNDDDGNFAPRAITMSALFKLDKTNKLDARLYSKLDRVDDDHDVECTFDGGTFRTVYRN